MEMENLPCGEKPFGSCCELAAAAAAAGDKDKEKTKIGWRRAAAGLSRVGVCVYVAN